MLPTLVEFRTPQHPSLGSHNWGGASPLLARNIPHESLEMKYHNLNALRVRDEIFTVAGNDPFLPPLPQMSYRGKGVIGNAPPRSSGLSRLFNWVRRIGRGKALGSNSNKKKGSTWRVTRRDPRNRWPNGWC